EVLELLVDEALEACEFDDRVETLRELLLREADQHAVDLDVRPRRELVVEADAELDERRDPAADPHRSAVGAIDACEHLEQRALAAPVRADDAEELALGDRERHLAERVVALVLDPLEGMREVLLEPRTLLVRDPERLRDAHRLDRAHAASSFTRSRLATQTDARAKPPPPRA